MLVDLSYLEAGKRAREILEKLEEEKKEKEKVTTKESSSDSEVVVDRDARLWASLQAAGASTAPSDICISRMGGRGKAGRRGRAIR